MDPFLEDRQILDWTGPEPDHPTAPQVDREMFGRARQAPAQGRGQGPPQQRPHRATAWTRGRGKSRRQESPVAAVPATGAGETSEKGRLLGVLRGNSAWCRKLVRQFMSGLVMYGLAVPIRPADVFERTARGDDSDFHGAG